MRNTSIQLVIAGTLLGFASCSGPSGNPGTADAPTTSPDAPSGPIALVSITAGDRYTCGRTAGGAYCW
jgi:hypothetical protein